VCCNQAERAEKLLYQLCHEEYGGIRLTPHMCNLVVDAWCKLENMRRAELLAQKMDEEEVIFVKPDQFEGTESETCFAFPAPNHETYEILADGWQRCGMADEVGEGHSVFKLGAAATAKSLAGTRGAVRAAASMLSHYGIFSSFCTSDLHLLFCSRNLSFLHGCYQSTNPWACVALLLLVISYDSSPSGVIGTWGRRRSGYIGNSTELVRKHLLYFPLCFALDLRKSDRKLPCTPGEKGFGLLRVERGDR